MSTYIYLALAIALGVYAAAKVLDLAAAIFKGVGLSGWEVVGVGVLSGVTSAASVWLLTLAGWLS